ncbi:DUF1553 domain-containing protein [Crateriforma conspicua]|uniref:DUF1553 domain-containing protein n=1 Tax=Crateriforma conspicua TaxID=2527996 RepID=UPI00118BB2A1|nr:DUF1553 domain-containing protein [Crateriforma conspicua]QDV65646.1 Planctomycete cytochrome C [Crateriforma conspicua]
MHRCVLRHVVVLACLVISQQNESGAADAPADAPADSNTPDPIGLEIFEKVVRPTLVKHCYECHSDATDDVGGDLWLDSADAMRSGGISGPAIIPGRPGASTLLSALEYRDTEMPPDGQLPPETIASFRKWIARGAPDPRKSKGKTPAVPDTKSASPAASELWSIQPVVAPEVPVIQDDQWSRSDVDRFILAGLRERAMSPNRDAAPEVLIRRLSFDLLGLPPSPELVASFTADPSETHYAKIVDAMLGSKEFGRRWARHWLDVVRYGESAGSSRDVLMIHAWRYRDYVIDALNRDLPYDQFVTDQIAGDLLDSTDAQERERQRIATGMLAIGSKSLNGGNLTHDIVDDQIDVVSKAFLGLTVSCARCHDHKFDPIPTADYYALSGIFQSTETLYGGGTNRPAGLADQLKVYLSLDPLPDAKTRKDLDQLQKKATQLQRQIAASKRQLPNRIRAVPEEYRNADPKSLPDTVDRKTATAVRQLSAARKILKQRQDELASIDASILESPRFFIGVREKGKANDAAILIRGEKNQRGEVVPRSFLSAVNQCNADLDKFDAQIGKTESGRRELAQWIVASENPLTSRVIVNRIWQHLMGRGIVETVDNFGVSGSPPSHPTLLDHLAHTMVNQHHWSLKSMVRELVHTSTYRQSSEFDPTDYQADPDNRLRWRMSRRQLEAEPFRDAMLTVSGLIDVSPLDQSLVARIGEGEVGRNLNTRVLEEPFNRRSIYLPIIRGLVPESLKIFDFPEPSNIQGMRSANTTPTQSLYLMNSPDVIRMARSFASNLLNDPSLADDQARITHAYHLCFARSPGEDEIQRARGFIKQPACIPDDASRSNDSSKPIDARLDVWTVYCQTLLASAEFRLLN